METIGFTITDNRAVYPELCFDTHAHVVSIPTLDISLPAVLKAAGDSFLQALSIEDRKRFRKFCHDAGTSVSVLTGKSILLPLRNCGRFCSALAVYKDDDSVSVRYIQNPWDIYDPSMPVFHSLSAIVQKFCKECQDMDTRTTDGSILSCSKESIFPLLTDIMPGYITETLDNLRGNGNRLCDLRELNDWILTQVRNNPLFMDTDITLFDPLSNTETPLVIPLHLSGWMYVFLLMTHMMSALSTDRRLQISVLVYEDRVDFRWETTSNLSSSHFRSEKSLAALADAVPALRVPAELVQALGIRHGFESDIRIMRSHLSCTMTVYRFTEHLLDFKFNDPLGRAKAYYPEAAALFENLQSFSEPQEERAGAE